MKSFNSQKLSAPMKRIGRAEQCSAPVASRMMQVARQQVQSGDKRKYRAGAGSNPDKLFPG
jgi:hypothetical protein